MALTSGTKLGRYEVRSKIGEGGMGEVYLALDTKLGRKVALKILPPELASNQDRMRRFTQEAKAAAALNHPNIAHIYEIGEHELLLLGYYIVASRSEVPTLVLSGGKCYKPLALVTLLGGPYDTDRS